MRLLALASLLCAFAPPLAAQPDLRGHGGPVRALAVSPDGERAISGSFDSSAIVWSLQRGRALAVLRVHESSVNAVLATGTSFVTAGEDGQIAIWAGNGGATPLSIFRAHEAPIAALALSPDGRFIASAGWDGRVRVAALGSPIEARIFEGHKGNVNGVAFSTDGQAVLSAGYDATLRISPLDGSTPKIVTLPSPLNALALLPGGRLAASGADGSLFFLGPDGVLVETVQAADAPVIALAVSPDGATLVAASPRGAVIFFDTETRKQRFTLTGPGLPVWSLAFTRDGRELLTGGSDRIVRRWNALNGDPLGPLASPAQSDIPAELANTRGAEIFKACSICHALTPDGENRAGPTLHGIFGRRIGTAPNYAYSRGFADRDIIWTPETVARLFEVGPNAMTPGTKMPEQTVGNPEDRKALTDFLTQATTPR